MKASEVFSSMPFRVNRTLTSRSGGRGCVYNLHCNSRSATAVWPLLSSLIKMSMLAFVSTVAPTSSHWMCGLRTSSKPLKLPAASTIPRKLFNPAQPPTIEVFMCSCSALNVNLPPSLELHSPITDRTEKLHRRSEYCEPASPVAGLAPDFFRNRSCLAKKCAASFVHMLRTPLIMVTKSSKEHLIKATSQLSCCTFPSNATCRATSCSTARGCCASPP
mmetsp:Transcript_67652/g.126380  ORF Transcript_67652/g.126380 Transcript_67652/m.126380 type:complete len:219 (-) Transcript_67652:341-997(-)